MRSSRVARHSEVAVRDRSRDRFAKVAKRLPESCCMRCTYQCCLVLHMHMLDSLRQSASMQWPQA